MEPAASDPIRDLGEKVDAILAGMSPVEKEDAISKLQGVLDKQYMLLMKGEPEVCKCSHCNSEEVSRYGHDKAGSVIFAKAARKYSPLPPKPTYSVTVSWIWTCGRSIVNVS